jgi:ATP synthase F1 complex assembly factor 2
VTLKRFWKQVDVMLIEDRLAITLDKRPLKTPAGKNLLVPKEKQVVASLIASEWDGQVTVLKPHTLPMVRYIESIFWHHSDYALDISHLARY